MALTRKYINSPNVSSRYNMPVKRGVIHSSEGATTGQSLGNFFANPSAQVSSHAGIDDLNDNIVWIYVDRSMAAWTAGNANGDSFQVELCCPSGASANWSTATWKAHPNMLRKCAAWIAEESKYYGVPIKDLTPSQAQGSGKGMCQHSDLGAWGGGHYDCGNGFPMQYVLDMANGKAAPPTLEDEYMPNLMKLGADAKTPVAMMDGVKRIRFYTTASPDNPALVQVRWAESGAKSDLRLSTDSSSGVNVPDGVGDGARLIRQDDGTDEVSFVLLS